ncbi:MAG: hypothetical protein ACRDPA_29295 [Solirubrobacteraceae bacterium]
MTITELHDSPGAKTCEACQGNIQTNDTDDTASDHPFAAWFADNPPKFGRGPERPNELRPMLSGQELVDWLALSRVRTGGVVRCRDEYLEGGQRMPCYLVPELLFDVLLRAGLLQLDQPDPAGLTRLSLTDAGRARYEELCELAARRSC